MCRRHPINPEGREEFGGMGGSFRWKVWIFEIGFQVWGQKSCGRNAVDFEVEGIRCGLRAHNPEGTVDHDPIQWSVFSGVDLISSTKYNILRDSLSYHAFSNRFNGTKIAFSTRFVD